MIHHHVYHLEMTTNTDDSFWKEMIKLSCACTAAKPVHCDFHIKRMCAVQILHPGALGCSIMMFSDSIPAVS